jgi:ribonuclease HII
MAVVVGIDEVGRGCWAGPLVAAAVALDGEAKRHLEDGPIELRDSKKLSQKNREALDAAIRSQVKSIGVGWVTPGEIDKLGLTKSVRLAMLRAVKELHLTCNDYDQIIIDGNLNFFKNAEGLKTTNIQAIIKADDTVPAVSAASIIAKVARDNYMRELALKFPEYGFDQHVGYGTAAHSAALKQHGVTKHHRMSYEPIKKVVRHGSM